MDAKDKKKMTPAKQRLIKSAVSLVATTLVLGVVTVAWFIDGGGAKVDADAIGGLIEEQSGFGYRILEAFDDNKNGELDLDENTWYVVAGETMEFKNFAPNQSRFFKIEVDTGSVSGAKLHFGEVVLNPDDDEAAAEDFLKKYQVRFAARDEANQPLQGISDIDQSLFALLGNPPTSDKTVYSLDFTDYPNQAINIYYILGVYGDAVPEEAERDFALEIGRLYFTID